MERREQIEAVDADPDVPDLDSFTRYEDGDHLVICDKHDPNAWVRSDEVVDVEV